MRGIFLRSLHDVVSGMTKTAARFPLPLACALVFGAVIVSRTHDLDLFESEDSRDRLLVLVGLGFFLFLSVKLFVERRNLSLGSQLALAVIGISLIALQVFWVEPKFYWSSPAILFLAPALVLSVTVAPFRLGTNEQAAFWNFNRSAWLSAAFAFLAATALALGLMAVGAALERLFGVDVPSEIYSDIWALSWSVFWPWLALAGVTDEFPVPEDAYCPRPLAFLMTYVLVPLAIAYLALLCAYIVKIAVQWSLPQGEIGYLVNGFAVFGVAAHLLAFPLRDTGVRWVRLFHRHFYHALFAPACLLAVAIGIRVSQYGVSEARFAVMVFAAWMFVMAAAFTFWSRKAITIVPLSLAVLLALSSFGPWGASAVATKSQVAHLERLLTESGLLIKGRIAPARAPVSWEEQKRISSVILYLYDTGKLAALRPWFADSGLDPASVARAQNILSALGIKFVRKWETGPRVDFSVRRDEQILDVRGFDLLTRLHVKGDSISRKVLTDPATGAGYRFSYDRDAAALRITGPDDDQVQIDLGALVFRLRQGAPPDDSHEGPSVEGADGDLRIRLYIESVNAELDGESARLEQAFFLILVGRPDTAQ